MTFNLHPQLQKDTLPVGDLGLSRVLLMNNKRFPWIILVPMRAGLREIFDLAPADYRMAMDEIRHATKIFSELTGAHKINVAALGNMVPQLHIHIIARFKNDAAWPKPAWDSAAAVYASGDGAALAEKTAHALKVTNITKM